MAVVSLDFVDSKSGRIYWNGSSYTAYTGWAACQTGQDGDANHRDRAFFNFDTSSVPTGAVINSVKFLCRRRADPIGEPQTYQLQYYIGTFIGAALDGDVGEWTAGTICLTQVAKPLDKTTYDLGAAAVNALNDSGDTDLRLADNSTEGTGDATWGTNFNKTASLRCKLVVDYTEAELGTATVTGKGTASGSAVLELPNAATVTGMGSISATAVLEVPGAATVTGVGGSAGVAVLEVPGAATVTGAGTVEGFAAIWLTGVGTVTGAGSATGAPTVWLTATVTATGFGTVSAAGNIARWGEHCDRMTGGPRRAQRE